MKVKHLRVGDFVTTSVFSCGTAQVRARNSYRITGILVDIEKRPGNNFGPLATVVTPFDGIMKFKASFILTRDPFQSLL